MMQKKTGILIATGVILAMSPALAQSPEMDPATQPTAPSMNDGAQPATPLTPKHSNPEPSDKTMGTNPQVAPSDNQASVKPADLLGLPIFSSDGEKLGAVTNVRLDGGMGVASIYTEVGGFLGLGEKTVEINKEFFDLVSDKHIKLTITAKEAESLPEAGKAKE